MIERILKLSFFSGDSAKFIVRVDLFFVDRDRLLKMIQGPAFLPPVKIDQPQLNMSIGISRIDRCILQKSFQVLSLTKGITETSHFTAEKATEINNHPKEKKGRKEPRRNILENVHCEADRGPYKRYR